MNHTGKTNRSFLKRVKITGRGKITKRPNHQDHFNAKEPGNSARRKKGRVLAPKSLMKIAKALLQSNI